MAECDWDTVTVLRKKGPSSAQAKSKQVSQLSVPKIAALLHALGAPWLGHGCWHAPLSSKHVHPGQGNSNHGPGPVLWAVLLEIWKSAF